MFKTYVPAYDPFFESPDRKEQNGGKIACSYGDFDRVTDVTHDDKHSLITKRSVCIWTCLTDWSPISVRRKVFV